MKKKKQKIHVKFCHRTSKKKGFIFILIALIIGLALVFLFRGDEANAEWWNAKWSYRKKVNITNSGVEVFNQYVKVTLDTASLISASKLQSSCADLRITNAVGKILPYFIDGDTNYDCNDTDTAVYVMVDKIPTSGARLYVYYGNTLAPSGEVKIGTFRDPAPSCRAILEHGDGSVDGDHYFITPTGNRADRIQVTCDMDYDNGGWILVFHGLPSEAMVLDTTNERVKLSNNIVFNEMRMEGVNLNFDVSTTVTETAQLSKTIPQLFYDIDQESDDISPKVKFYDLDGNQDVGLTDSNYFMFGYGNSWRVFYTCVNVSGINNLYLGGYTPTCTPRASFVSTDVGCSGGGDNYCSNARTIIPVDSGLGLSLYEYQETKTWVRENDITLNIDQSAGSAGSEEVSPAPIGYWSFSEGSGTIAYDRSSHNNDGTIFNAVWKNNEDCISGKCLYFDGSADFVEINHGGEINNNGGSVSISVWVRANDTDGWQEIISNSVGQTSTRQWGLVIDANMKIQWWATASSWGSKLTSATTLEENKWYHIELVHNDNNNITLYINGKQDKQVSISGEIGYSPTYITIGKRYDGEYLKSFVDEVKIYPYARSAVQVKTDYNAGLAGVSSNIGVGVAMGGQSKNDSPVAHWGFDAGFSDIAYDSGTGDNDATISGASWTNQGKIGKALSFDGSGTVDGTVYGDNVVVLEDVTNTNNYPDGCTYSFWLYVDTDAVDRMSLFRGSGTIRHIEIYSSGKKFRTEAGLQNGYSFGTGSFPDDVRGKWSHFVIVFANNETNRPVRWYQNGKLFYTGSMDGGTYPGTEYFSFSSIGRSTGSVNYLYAKSFDGLIDEVKIFDYALVENEVLQEYNQGKAMVLGSVGTESDGSVSSSAERAYCPPGDTTASCGPIGEWKMDEKTGSTVYDTSGNSNNGTILNATWARGKYGAGLKFDGTGDYVSLSPSTLPTDEITISVWVKIDEHRTYNRFIANRWGGVEGDWLLFENSGSWIWGIIKSDNSQSNIAVAHNSTKGWTHLLATYDGTTQKLYINGVNSGSDLTHSTILSQGGLLFSSGGTDGILGKMDNVKIYDYAMDEAQAAWDYNHGKPIAHYKLDECSGSVIHDYSGNGNSGTLTIGASGSNTTAGTCTDGSSASAWYNGVDGKRNYSMSFDGTDDYISITNATGIYSSIHNNFSFAFWVKYGGTSSSQWPVLLGTTSTHNYPGVRGGSAYGANPVYLEWGSYPTCDGSSWSALSTKDETDGNWHHVVFTYDGTTVKNYFDGQYYAQAAQSGMCSGGTNFYLNSSYNGQLDDVQIFNYPLTAQQVKNIYNGGAVNFAPSSGTP